MGKEQGFKPPELDELLSSCKKIKYTGDNQDRIRIQTFITSFNKILLALKMHQRTSPEYIQDLAVAALVFGLEDIDTRTTSLLTHLKIKNKHSRLATELKSILKASLDDIPSRSKFIYLSKLFHYMATSNLENISGMILPLVKDALAKVYREVFGEVDALAKAIPTEAAISSILSKLVHLYLAAKESQKKEPNDDFVFLAEFGQAIEAIANDPPISQDEKNDIYAVNRSWQIKIGAVLFFMIAIRENSYFLQFFSRYKNGEFYKQCASALKDLDSLDSNTKFECLAAFRNFMTDFQVRGKLREYGRTHFQDSERFAFIDAALYEHEILLEKELKRLVYTGGSTFPAWTIIFMLLGSIAVAPIGYGFGAAAGQAFAQTDTMVPIVTWMSRNLTSKIMHMGLGESGRNMAYKASELITQNIFAYGLGATCQAMIMAVGGLYGAAIGASVDLTSDGLNNFRDSLKVPAYITDKELEFVVALFTLPPDIAKAEILERIKYVTTGMTLFNPPQLERVEKQDSKQELEREKEETVAAGYSV